MSARPPARRRRGMALLVTLLLVAVMSAAAVATLEDLRFGLRRAANTQATAQARWYAVGAVALAASQLQRAGESPDARAALAALLNGPPLTFPIEDGLITARLSDGGNCFNLNSLADPAPPPEAEAGAPAPRRAADLGFLALLDALGAAERDREALLAALRDWMDPDGERTGAGAEDDAYARAGLPQRTAGAAFAETSELRAVLGVDPATYRALRPFVCALPSLAPATLNLNTLRPDQAALLTGLTRGRLTAPAAAALLEARPVNGWADAGAFWAQPGAQAAPVTPELLAQTGVATRFVALEVTVAYLDAEVVLSALLEQKSPREVVAVARRWTREE